MTHEENGSPDEADSVEALKASAGDTLRAAENALKLAVEVFADLISDARSGDIAKDTDIRQAAGRLTGLQQTLLKELAKYEHETGYAIGAGRAAPIDFVRARFEIGSALDRIRTRGGTDAISE